MNRIYLDNNASTKVYKEVIDAMLPFFSENYGNAASTHAMGKEALQAVQHSREQIARVIGANPDEIFFTSGGTESDNLAIYGIAIANCDKGKHIIISSIEHLAISEMCEYLEEEHFLKKECFNVTYLPVDSLGRVDPREVERAITPETILISIMMVNNEIGTIQRISDIGKIAKKHGVAFHSDAVCAVGKMNINVHEFGLDLLSLDAHKIHGPKGIGALYVKNGIKLKSFILGGCQEKQLRAGTLNVPGIVGMGKACEMVMNNLDDNITKITSLRDRLIEGLLKVEGIRIRLNGPRDNRAPNNVHVSISSMNSVELLNALDEAGIEASTGSACLPENEKSHVLQECFHSLEETANIRFTLSEFTTDDEIDYVVKHFSGIIKNMGFKA